MYCFIVILIFDKILYANSADPDQTPRSAASDLGLHCLPRSRKRDTRLMWVKTGIFHCLICICEATLLLVKRALKSIFFSRGSLLCIRGCYAVAAENRHICLQNSSQIDTDINIFGL